LARCYARRCRFFFAFIWALSKLKLAVVHPLSFPNAKRSMLLPISPSLGEIRFSISLIPHFFRCPPPLQDFGDAHALKLNFFNRWYTSLEQSGVIPAPQFFPNLCSFE